MRRLIVNADDLGIGVRRNAGILESHRRGVVTSVSVLANGDAFEDGVRLLGENPRLSAGLHLNLSEGRPLVAGHRTLVDSTGGFLGKEEARRRAASFDPEEVEREVEAQLGRLRDSGVTPTHLDGHQHIQIYGALAAPISRAARRAGLRWIRRPADGEYRDLSAPIRFASPDHFLGIRLSRRFSLDALCGELRALREGTTELMVHPGYADEPAGFSGPERERELEALTDPAVRDLLDRENIELISFAAL